MLISVNIKQLIDIKQVSIDYAEMIILPQICVHSMY